MVTSNVRHQFGRRVATVATKTFNCLIRTAKDGLLRKQSVEFFDISDGMASPRRVARLSYNDSISSQQRLDLHDRIVTSIDASGTKGLSLQESLQQLFVSLKRELVGLGTFLV
ncbi:MAG TPA: hypothetical protein VK569_11240 [Bacteroidota bacterium]|nr:hypothetical protein [Bacteroidota bacterium]